ncbi:MAG: helix-turn-helix domain-containing protein, partial [bacterium]
KERRETTGEMDDPPGPYDRVGPADDLWFVPDVPPDPADLYPLPGPDQGRLIKPGDWAAAQAASAPGLARLALLYGVLDERLRAGPAGWRHRLALIEAADLSWDIGDRVSVARLGLWEARHLSGVQEDAQGLARASWAFRRLAGPVAPGGDLAGFLGRHGAAADVADLAVLMTDLADLHPVPRAVAVAQAWRQMGDDGPARGIEAAVLAARLAAEMAPDTAGTGFVPRAGYGGSGGGSPQSVLAAWLAGAARATQARLMYLERLRAWQGRALASLADCQGRTPRRLLEVLVEWPMVSAAMAEQSIGANRATVLRNLALLQSRGLLREVTGQGRYRVWTARL